jgi:formylglycine-generating enzyme required for sulfatase activity
VRAARLGLFSEIGTKSFNRECGAVCLKDRGARLGVNRGFNRFRHSTRTAKESAMVSNRFTTVSGSAFGCGIALSAALLSKSANAQIVLDGQLDVGSDSTRLPRDTRTVNVLMERYEVTQAHWMGKMGMNPSPLRGPAYSNAGVLAVKQGSWTVGLGFLAATDSQLPTKAEWACAWRVGTLTGWSGEQYPSSSLAVNPPGTDSSPQSSRVVRGGSWVYSSQSLCSSGRNLSAGSCLNQIGFRVARNP